MAKSRSKPARRSAPVQSGWLGYAVVEYSESGKSCVPAGEVRIQLRTARIDLAAMREWNPQCRFGIAKIYAEARRD